MISANVELFNATTYANLRLAHLPFCVEVYTGTMPSDDVFTNPDNHSGNDYSLDSIRSSLPEDCVRLGSLCFEADIIAEYAGNIVVLPLSDSVKEMEVESAGTATWFMLYTSTSSTTNQITSGASFSARQMLVGTVGDLSSGSDMEVPNSEVTLDRDFKFGDVTFNLV